MGGSPSKRPRPSYEDGEIRDPEVAALIDERAPDRKEARKAVAELIRRAAHKVPPA